MPGPTPLLVIDGVNLAPPTLVYVILVMIIVVVACFPGDPDPE